jgi:hypothetical protein
MRPEMPSGRLRKARYPVCRVDLQATPSIEATDDTLKCDARMVRLGFAEIVSLTVDLLNNEP